MSYRELILSRLQIPNKGDLVLAFSGGSDSLALLSLLPPERTKAVYVNHNIRGQQELEKEIELNRRNAERFGIPFEVLAIERGQVDELSREGKMGIEAAARRLRYSLLSKAEASYILTAHHQDDQVETFLMRISSGSPVYSLEGIRYRDGRIIRPLLNVPKSWIMGYLEEEGLEYSSDSTNYDLSYERNRIRHLVLPFLTDEQKDLISRICCNAGLLRKKGEEIILSRNPGYVSFCLGDYSASPVWWREKAVFDINHYFGYTKRLSRNEFGKIDAFLLNKGSSHFETSRFSIFKRHGIIRFFAPAFCFVTVFDPSGTLVPGFLISAKEENGGEAKMLCLDFSFVHGTLVLRTDRLLDEIELKEGVKRISELKKEYGIPYCYVLEDKNGLVAVLSSFLGGRDRLSRRFLGKKGLYIAAERMDEGKKFFSSTFSYN